MTADLLARARVLTQAADRIGRTLVELDADPDRLMLDQARFSGETARRWSEARDLIAGLWASYARLRPVADRVDHLVAGRLDAAQAADVEALLDGPSVLLDEERHGPVQRGLLEETTTVQRIRPAELVAQMSAQYEQVREVVVAVTACWADARRRISSARSLLDEAEQLAAALGDPDDTSVSTARQELAKVAATAFEDPLALGAADLDACVATADALVAALRAATSLRSDMEGAMQRARARREELAGARNRVRAARELASEKVVDPAGPASTSDERASEAAWADLQQAVAAARWAEVARLLASWHTATGELLAALADEESAWRAPVDERDELRARLDALRAVAIGRGAAEHEELAATYERAWECLHTAPCDLRRAHRLVTAYASSMDTVTHRGGNR